MTRKAYAHQFGPDRQVLGDALATQFVCGVDSLDDLINKWPAHGYCPTIFVDDPKRQLLADCYDKRAAHRGFSVRAYRCGQVAA